MQWQRCNKCGNMKPLDSFWKINKKPRKICIDCEKKYQEENKERKKEYDKSRYKESKDRTEIPTCFRCGKHKANVINNQLYWCFNCLKKYEKEYGQKIKVEILDTKKRKVKMSALSNYEFAKLVEKFVDKLENQGILDKELKSDIIEASNALNKEEIVAELIQQIKIFKDYDEKEVNFPYKKYVERLLV
jgi:hypothetical protein